MRCPSDKPARADNSTVLELVGIAIVIWVCVALALASLGGSL